MGRCGDAGGPVLSAAALVGVVAVLAPAGAVQVGGALHAAEGVDVSVAQLAARPEAGAVGVAQALADLLGADAEAAGGVAARAVLALAVRGALLAQPRRCIAEVERPRLVGAEVGRLAGAAGLAGEGGRI